MGRRRRRPRAHLRLPVALLARAGWDTHRPDQPGAADTAHQPGLTSNGLLGVERRRVPTDGAGGLPRTVPVLRRRLAAVLTDLPATIRPVHGRAIHYHQLRATDSYSCTDIH